jgi:hypothetical protein
MQATMPDQIQSEAIARRNAGEALTDIGRTYNVSHSTISRLWPKGAPLYAMVR